MKKTTFLIDGKHAVIEALKNEKSINQIKSKLESKMYNFTKRANRNNK